MGALYDKTRVQCLTGLRIIRDTYLKEVPSKRPRIFGMTASPVDTKGDVVDAAMYEQAFLFLSDALANVS